MSGLETLSLTIPTELAEALREAVRSGEFAALDDALADALTPWARRHEEREDDLAWVRAKIRASLADPDPDLSEDEVDERLRVMFDHGLRRTDAAA